MCDYSLHANPNRLANENEDLVAHRFPTGSIGLASPKDLKPRTEANRPKAPWWSLERLRSWFQEQAHAVEPVCAVCVPPGATLLLTGIPQELQRELGVSETETVRFTQISANAHSYRDAVRFANGRQILLQALREGQAARVMSLAPVEVEDHFESEIRSVVFP
ncbi:MAG: hypothetical protein SFV54_27715 [Bryobacteraceae bacterium]|nr:hypothetical protein [Bryobacteraceae bacterium]